MENKERKLYKTLMLLFWANILLLLTVLTFILFSNGLTFGTATNTNVVFEQYTILISLASIPIALKLFHTQYRRIAELEHKKFLKKYLPAYILRMFVLDAAAILNIAGLYLFNSKNSVYMTIIIIFALFFCYPNRKTLEEANDTTSEIKD